MQEYLTSESNKRYTLFPLQYPDLWNLYKSHQELYWTADEIDLSQDLKHWNKLNSNEQHFIEHILAFFAASDGIVLENLLENFTVEVTVLEARYFYSFQAMIENIHGEMYSRLIEALITDKTKKNNLFNAMDKIPAVKKKAEWALKWISSDCDFATRLVAFAIVEGIFFSGAFCSIDWIKYRKLGLKGLTDSNNFIMRDEGLHTDFAVHLYRNHVQNKLSDDKISEIMKEAVAIEIEFITEAIPCSLLGMNHSSMQNHIEFMANRLLSQLGYKPIWSANETFHWMENRNLEESVNFFEKRNQNYKKPVIRDYSKIDKIENEVKLEFNGDFDF